eukprot:g13705.t1
MWTEDICKNIFKKNIDAIASNYYSITGEKNNENDTHEFEHFLVKRWFTSTEEIIQKNEESTDEDTTINTDDEIMRSVHLCIDILNNATDISNPLKHKNKNRWDLYLIRGMAHIFFANITLNYDETFVRKTKTTFELINKDEMHVFFEIALFVLIKAIAPNDETSTFNICIHHYFPISETFIKIILRPLSRYVHEATEDDMKTLVGLIIQSNSNNDGANCKYLYTFFSILWQEKYIPNKKDMLMKGILREMICIIQSHLHRRLHMMDGVNHKLAKVLTLKDVLVTKDHLNTLVSSNIENNLDTIAKLMSIEQISSIFENNTLSKLLCCVWEMLSTVQFDTAREDILIRYAFLETCFRLNRKDLKSDNIGNAATAKYYKIASMLFKKMDLNILNKAISSPSELPIIFLKKSHSVLPRDVNDVVDSIIVIALSKCHIETNAEDGKTIREDMITLFSLLLKENVDDGVMEMIEKLEKALMFSNIPGNTKESTGKVRQNAANKITQILREDGVDFEVANDIGTNLAMIELDKLQEKYEQMENIVNSVKEPKDIWNLLLGHVLGGTKSQSALVLKEFIKKRVTPWVDFTTDLLVLIALYEQDDIGNVENNDGSTSNINSDFWTGIALFESGTN